MDALRAIDSLDELLHTARPVPLTDEVRIDSGELARLLEDVRVAIPPELTRAKTSGAPTLFERLDSVIRDAKPVPLTKQVRVDKEGVYTILDELRASLSEEPRQAHRPRADLPSPPSTTVSAEEAARSLPALLHKVRFGSETIEITLNGTPMAELRPPAAAQTPSE